MSFRSMLRRRGYLSLVWRRSLRKWAPEIAALAVYLIMSLAALIPLASSVYPWVDGAAWGYLVAAGILTFVPLSLAASSLTGERQMGTLDALILTPVDRRRLAWERYWNCVFPWLRFIAWLLPLYLVLFLSRPAEPVQASWLNPAISATLCGLGSKPALGYLILEHGEQMALRSELQALCVAVRAIRDCVTLLLVCGIGLYASARTRTRAGSMIAGLVVVLVLLGGVLSLPEWFIVGQWDIPGVENVAAAYFLWSLMVVLTELLVALIMARSVARNFDHFLLRESRANAA